MNRISIIWDLDGTIIDSYSTILSCIYDTLLENNINIDKNYIYQRIIKHSVNLFTTEVSEKYNISKEKLERRIAELTYERRFDVELIRNAQKTLDTLSELGVNNFIYTHKGESTYPILENLNIKHYFKEIITYIDGYPRKPNPDAVNYLIEKYKMNRKFTYYVGDRRLDIECANNAEIKSILYLPENSYVEPTGSEDYIVQDLYEIVSLFNI